MKNSIVPLLILLIFGVMRFALTAQLDSIGEYAPYVFEMLFIVAVGAYYRNRIEWKINILEWIKGFAPALILGAVAYLGASPLGITVPFDMGAGETLLFLLMIGPVLEEFLFRFALWEPMVDLLRIPWLIIGANAVLFSYAHFHSYWFAPEEYHSFLIYQSLYVLGLAVHCGLRRLHSGTITAPLMVHVAFNLGFTLAAFAVGGF